MSEPVKAAIVAGIVLVALVAYATKSDRPDPICTDRDMAVTERIFTACMAAQAGQAHSAYSCRQETERLSCKSWSRP